MSSEMERLLLEEEQNYQEVYKGSRVKGTVEVIKPDSFYISLSYKTDGVLPKSEAGDCEDIKVGDTLDLEVIKIDKNTGEILLSKKRLDDFKAWDEIQMGDIINVKVTEKNEKGLIAKFKGSIRGFLPLSHIETRFIGEDALDKYIGQEFETEIIDLDPKKRRLILSRKNILLKEQNELKKELVNIRYDFSKEKIALEPKKRMIGRIGISPDHADALMLSCIVDSFSIRCQNGYIPKSSRSLFLSLMKPQRHDTIYGKFTRFVY